MARSIVHPAAAHAAHAAARHRRTLRGATPLAGVARSSRSSAPEFRSADGSRRHSGECAQSLDVLIPTRRVARLLRGTRSRTYVHRHLAVVGVCRTDWHPISRDRRPALLSGQTWPSRRRRRQKDSRRSQRDHVLSTLSHARRGRAFRLIGRGKQSRGQTELFDIHGQVLFQKP